MIEQDAAPGSAQAADAAAGTPSRWRRRLVVLALLAIAILFVGYVALSFLGSQVREILKGTIEFGRSGAACDVSDRTTTFKPGDTIYIESTLARDVRAGETVTSSIWNGATLLGTSDHAVTASANCMGGQIPAAAIPIGHIKVQYSVGTEVLATGQFDVVSP
jgi:hypothetical protein